MTKVFSSVEQKDGDFVARVYEQEGQQVELVASGRWRSKYGLDMLRRALRAANSVRLPRK